MRRNKKQLLYLLLSGFRSASPFGLLVPLLDFGRAGHHLRPGAQLVRVGQPGPQIVGAQRRQRGRHQHPRGRRRLRRQEIRQTGAGWNQLRGKNIYFIFYPLVIIFLTFFEKCEKQQIFWREKAFDSNLCDPEKERSCSSKRMEGFSSFRGKIYFRWNYKWNAGRVFSAAKKERS